MENRDFKKDLKNAEQVSFKVSIDTNKKKIYKAVKLMKKVNKLLSKVYSIQIEDANSNTHITGN